MMKKIILISLSLLATYIAIPQQSENKYSNETQIGNTYYDLQTMRSMQNRMYQFNDGTIAAVWNQGFDYPDFPDLGTGYNNNYSNELWNEMPDSRIESQRAKNPSITANGVNGEIIASQGEHYIILNKRDIKGQGDWVETLFYGPEGHDLVTPYIMCSGENNEVLHLFALTKDTTSGGVLYNEQSGALVYSRSVDGGESWEIQNQAFEELGIEHYLGFYESTLSVAAPIDNTLAFTIGDYMTDLVLMKSEDGGDSWEKTIIWEHPYPKFNWNMLTDSFFCVDGSHSCALDYTGKVHAAFGISRLMNPTSGIDSIVYFPRVDGIGKWTEDIPVFSNCINALAPPQFQLEGSEMLEEYTYAGKIQDTNGDGLTSIGSFLHQYPQLGSCSTPSISVFATSDFGIISYSSPSEEYETYSNSNHRHIWLRYYEDLTGLDAWITNDISHWFHEIIFNYSFTKIDFSYSNQIFQADDSIGIAVLNDHEFIENIIYFNQLELWIVPGCYNYFESDTTEIIAGDSVHFNSSLTPMDSYNWIFDGGIPASSTEEFPVIRYDEPGIYSVRLQYQCWNDSFYHTDYKENYITVYNYDNIKEIEKDIVILPNPNNGLFIINSSGAKMIHQISVHNTSGQNILNQSYINRKNIQIDLTEFPHGIYFINIQTDKGNIVKKVVVQ